MKFKWSNAQINKQQNKTKMCRLREDWAQWIDLGLILLESVLSFEVTHYSVNFQQNKRNISLHKPYVYFGGNKSVEDGCSIICYKWIVFALSAVYYKGRLPKKGKMWEF